MLLEWFVLKWKEKVASNNKKSAGADCSRGCLVDVGLGEKQIFIDNLFCLIMDTNHGYHCILNNYSVKGLTKYTLLCFVNLSKIKEYKK